MTPSRALLLVGSAKASATSTSAALGRYLLDRLEAAGLSTTTMTVNRTGHESALLAAIAETDLLVVSTPLYVDSFPYLVTRAFEAIHATRGVDPSARSCALAFIVNCGFPEAAHCDTAMAMARIFARRARFDWAGGLALGEGGAIDGRSLADLGRLTRHVRAALDLAAAALADGRRIPAEATARMARRMMPARLYTLGGNVGWMRQAARNGVSRRQLRARPYSP
jgi:hypothetical protein